VLGVHAAHRGRPWTEPTADERATWHEMVETANLTVYLAEIEGRPVGTASLLVMPNLGYDGAHDLYRGLGFAPEAEGFRLYLRSGD
jgi:hypothetical protein